MTVNLTPSQAIGDHLFNLTESLLEGEQVKIADCFTKFKSLIDAHFIRSKTISTNELKGEINLLRSDSFTPLLVAACRDNFEIAEYLLKLGADPNLSPSHLWFGANSLHFAAAYGFLKMVNLLMAYGADLHAITNKKKTPLHLAACFGHIPAMQSLIAHGAKLDQLDEDRCSASYYICNRGLPGTEALFPVDDITAEIMARRFLAHVHGIGGTTTIAKDVEVNLAGSHSYIVCRSLLPYLTAFDKLRNGMDRDHYDEVLRAFRFAAYARSPGEYLSRIQSGELTFIHTGWQNHAICVGFKGSIGAVLNKGEGVTGDRKPIHAFPIDMTKLTIVDIIDILDEDETRDAIKGEEFFYQTLPQRLSSPQSKQIQKLCDDLRVLCTPKLIKAGTCTYGALKAAMQFSRFVLTLLKHPDQPYRNVERLSQIKTFCSQFSTFCRLKSIHDYLIIHFGDVLDKDLKTMAQRLAKCDFSLVERAWLKVNRRLVKEKHRCHPLSKEEKALGNQIHTMVKKIRAAATVV